MEQDPRLQQSPGRRAYGSESQQRVRLRRFSDWWANDPEFLTALDAFSDELCPPFLGADPEGEQQLAWTEACGGSRGSRDSRRWRPSRQRESCARQAFNAFRTFLEARLEAWLGASGVGFEEFLRLLQAECLPPGAAAGDLWLRCVPTRGRS